MEASTGQVLHPGDDRVGGLAVRYLGQGVHGAQGPAPWLEGMASFSSRMAAAWAFCTVRMACSPPRPPGSLLLHGLGPQGWRFPFRPRRSGWRCVFALGTAGDLFLGAPARPSSAAPRKPGSGGRVMFLTSRFTLMPPLVGSLVRMAVIRVLITSRLVRVLSRSISPMMLRRVGGGKVLDGQHGPLHP